MNNTNTISIFESYKNKINHIRESYYAIMDVHFDGFNTSYFDQHCKSWNDFEDQVLELIKSVKLACSKNERMLQIFNTELHQDKNKMSDCEFNDLLELVAEVRKYPPVLFANMLGFVKN